MVQAHCPRDQKAKLCVKPLEIDVRNVEKEDQKTRKKREGRGITLICSKKKGSKIFRSYITNPIKLHTVRNFTATKTRQRWYEFNTIPTSEMILLGCWNNSGFNNDIRERLMLILMNLFKANVHINKFARDDEGEPPSPLCRNCEISLGGQAPPENYFHLFSSCPLTGELNVMYNNIIKPEYQSSIKKFFVTDHEFIKNYAHRTITSLLIFHLSKMRDITTNRNSKIMDSLKDSLFALCKVQKNSNTWPRKSSSMVTSTIVNNIMYLEVTTHPTRNFSCRLR